MTESASESVIESASRKTPQEPIPHWPGKLVSLGDYQVYVRSVPDQTPEVGPALSEPSPAEPARREPALCVHGLEGSSRNWTDLMDLLRPRLAADALDLPGFGESPPRPDGRYSIAALAQTVIALIERNGHGPVHLLGNSLGGAVCVKVAATRPDLIRTLTLISPALPDARLRLDLLRFPLMSVPGVGARLLRQVQHLPPERRVADVIANCYSDPGRFPQARLTAEVTELHRRDALDYAAAALVGSIRTLTAETLRGGGRPAWRDAALITAPTLVIYGHDDRLVNARMAGRAAHTFPNARIVVMPSTGHVAHMEHPRLVAAEIGVLLAAANLSGQTGQTGQAQTPEAGRAREFPLAPAG
jgi:pimeloyl-ACP methyl ester carboxylesterase